MANLGPVASYQADGYDPSYVFYEDLTYRLGSSESVSDTTVTCATSGVDISDAAATSADVTIYENQNDPSGRTISSGQAIQYRVTITSLMTADVTIVISYTTNASGADTVYRTLEIVEKVGDS